MKGFSIMPTTKTTKRTTKKASSTPKVEPENTTAVDETAAEQSPEDDTRRKYRARDVDTSQMILVRNGFQGLLVYKSSRTGELFEWDEFGGEQEMELRELINAKNSAKGFFINNWFLFDDEDAWVIDYLGVGVYYKNTLNVEEFDELFGMSPDEIGDIVASLSDGQKRSLSYRARVKIANEEIDSTKMIRALEEALGTALVEK